MNYFLKSFFTILLFSFAQLGAGAPTVLGKHIAQVHPIAQAQLVAETDIETTTFSESSESPKKNIDRIVHRRHSSFSAAYTSFLYNAIAIAIPSFLEKSNPISAPGFGNKCQSCCYDFLFRFCLF